VMNDMTRQHVREIFARGVELGRDPRAFSKIGDSTIENPYFMDRFDEPSTYNLGEYGYLQSTIDWYRGSFNRDSVGVRVGMHTWTVFDPMWADPRHCQGGEHVLECEVRIHNPSVIIFRLGANDAGVPDYVENNFRRMVEYSIENGIVPILGTKGDRIEGSDINNQIIRQIAAEYNIPLWDYDMLAATIPGRGLLPDGFHMTTYYAHDWSNLQAAFNTGHGVHTLAALVMLDTLWRVTIGGL
jgi:hypothetical protein